MDMYKKKSLKFSHEQFSRDSRHAESLRARESSRFKRLSVIRSINDSDFLEDHSMETKPEKPIEDTAKMVNQHEDKKLHKIPAEKPIETSVLQDTAKMVNQHEDNKLHKTLAQKNLKKPMSRTEMLKKWKEEKLAKQELEKKLKKKPFTVGGSMNKTLMKDPLAKPCPNLKSSFMNQSTLKFNSSVMGGSKIVSSSSLKPPKPTSNIKQAIPSSSCQPSRVPYDFKAAYSASKPVSGTIKAPNTVLRKPTTKATSSAVPTNKFAAAAKTVAAVNRIPTTRSIPVTGLPKPSKMQENPKNSIKMPNQVCSSLPKSTAAVARNIPVRPQSQMPASNIRMKGNSIKVPNKPLVKDIPKTNVPSKNNVFKKPISLKKPEPTANLKKGIPDREISKKPETKFESKKTSKCSTMAMSQDSLESSRESKKSAIQTACKKSPESDKNIKHSAKEALSDQSIESIPEFSFNCDVSVINPSTSFAPTDFVFQPPVLHDFFDDDSWDCLHVVKKYLSRTSTPSKETSERTSGSHAKETKDSIGKDPVVEEENKVILCQKSPDKASKNNPDFKLSLSGDFLGMETPDILLNNEIMDDMDGECNKNLENVNEISSCRLSINKSASKEIQNVALERNEQLHIDSCKKEININDLLSESFVLENELDLSKPKTEVNSNEITLAAPLICANINAIASDKPLVSECIEEIAPAVSIISEVTHEVRSNKSMISDNVVSSKPLQEADQIVAESMLKEVMDEETVSESKNNDLKDKLDESTDCSILQDLDISNVTKETQMMLMKLEEEENNDDFEKLEAVNLLDKKSTGSVPKRVSMLKSVSVLNAIVETSELDESNIHSPGKSSRRYQSSGTPKNLIRLSTSHKSEISDDIKKFPVEKENMSISITPRRSLRLSRRIPNISGNETIDVFSPFTDQTLKHLNTPRRSIRLINLNTPEENGEASYLKTGLSADFAALKLSSENVDPNDLLSFENSPIAARKPRKVSLLYSPDKRKSIRKSIKGDLICFSPSGS